MLNVENLEATMYVISGKQSLMLGVIFNEMKVPKGSKFFPFTPFQKGPRMLEVH